MEWRLRDLDFGGAMVALLFVALLGLFCAFIVDWCSGTDDVVKATVTGKRYVPESTHINTSTDHDGHISVTTTTDPEEFHLGLRGGSHVFDAEVSQGTYNRFMVGEPVFVKYRKGGLFGGEYVRTVMPSDRIEQ